MKIFGKVNELFEEICRQCDEANSASHLQIRYSTNIRQGNVEQICTLCEGRVSLFVVWYQQSYNSLDNAFLGVREFDECLLIPQGYMHLRRPELIGEKKFSPDLSPAREYGWRLKNGQGGFISSKELANKCVLQFLELIEKDASGRVRREG
jgi:hypothetical protein